MWVATLAGLLWWARRCERRPPRHRGPCNGLWFMVLDVQEPGLCLRCLRCGAEDQATRWKVEAATRENEVTLALGAMRVTGGDDGNG